MPPGPTVTALIAGQAVRIRLEQLIRKPYNSGPGPFRVHGFRVSAMLDEQGRASSIGRMKQGSAHCEECTIQIGDGYQESVAFEFVDEQSPPNGRVMHVCWRCWESLNRRKNKRIASSHSDHTTSRLS